MATILDRVREGRLYKLDPALPWRKQEIRRIYFFERSMRWMTETLPQEASNWQLELSPAEQVEVFLEVYCAGEELFYERQFKPLHHLDSGIWELKTADVRLFGWFAQRDCFVCTAGNTALRVKELRMYHAYRDEAVRFRESLALDKPDFVSGGDPNDVVSNFCP